MYAFYVVRGHTLEELESLTPAERLFYLHAMNKHFEYISSFIPKVSEEELKKQRRQLRRSTMR